MANCNLWRNFLLSGLLGAFLLAGTSFVRADDNKTLVGVVSTTHCGLKHSTADASGAACVNSCVNSGRGAYALVVDGEIYTLEGGAAELQKLAGLEAKVTGHVDGMTVHVASVAAGS